MDTPMPCAYFNNKTCTNHPCKYSHLPDQLSVQLSPNGPNICKRYLLDPHGCHRWPRTCWYSHDILSAGISNWQTLYNVLDDIRRWEFERTRLHDRGSFAARFMDMMAEQGIVRDKKAIPAPQERTDVVFRRISGDGDHEIPAEHQARVHAGMKRKTRDEDDAEGSHRSKVVKVKHERNDDDYRIASNGITNEPQIRKELFINQTTAAPLRPAHPSIVRIKREENTSNTLALDDLTNRSKTRKVDGPISSRTRTSYRSPVSSNEKRNQNNTNALGDRTNRLKIKKEPGVEQPTAQVPRLAWQQKKSRRYPRRRRNRRSPNAAREWTSREVQQRISHITAGCRRIAI